MCAAPPSRGEFDRHGRAYLSRLAILLLVANVSSAYTNLVWTKFGPIQGLWGTSLRGRPVAHYLGIPYAEPPVGDLRFRNPQPWNRTWSDVYNATKDGPKCIQMDRHGNVTGNEDCLYLNVFVPMISESGGSNNKFPVMLYIHGGQYSMGSSDSDVYSPEYFMDQNIILVTINYRLSIMGFFSTANRVSPGNYGVKDALMALRWVHENIEVFQGDPNSVTLCGHSVGAVTVHALALTKKTEGLFNKYIAQSGPVISSAVIKSKSEIRNTSLEAARVLGCLRRRMERNAESVIDDLATENSSTKQPRKIIEGESNRAIAEGDYDEQKDEEMMRCMRSADAKSIAGVVKYFRVWNNHPCCTFGPTIEEDSVDGILTIEPLEAVKTHQLRDIPCIISAVKDEGLEVTIDILQNPDQQVELINNLEAYVPFLLGYQNKFPNMTSFIRTIADFYFDGDIAKNLLQNVTKFAGDAAFLWPSYQMLKYQSQVMNASNYFCLFSYEGTFSTNISFGSQTRYGVSHGDELNYIFPQSKKQPPGQMLHNTGADVTMINIMTEMWASFATKGVPEAAGIPAWPDYKESHKFLQFGVGRDPIIVVKSDFLPDRMAFWEELSRRMTMQEQGSNNTTSTKQDNSYKGCSHDANEGVGIASNSEIFNAHARTEDGKVGGALSPSTRFCGGSDDYIRYLAGEIVSMQVGDWQSHPLHRFF
ncbi:esterase FE4-like [Andrena cerasifolii]|uniref:esterase FE4-like n=1 Tax=Andrena cerasifolii TaxID=2819439 RepID=UPI004037C57D